MKNVDHRNEPKRKGCAAAARQQNPAQPPADEKGASRFRRLYDEAARLIDAGQFGAALDLLNVAGASEELQNAKGVCLMRLGRHVDALQVYRRLVLKSGATWMRPELPLIYKTNFCTALLLCGHPAGCVSSLTEINREDHPSVIRLRRTIASWSSELRLWQKLLWWVGEEPEHPVTLDFVPGELREETGSPDAPRPEATTRGAA